MVCGELWERYQNDSVSDIVCSMFVDLAIICVHVAPFYVCSHGRENSFVVFKTIIMTKQDMCIHVYNCCMHIVIEI